MSPATAHGLLTNMLHHQALTQPRSAASVDAHGALTFEDLWNQAGRAAAALAGSGVLHGESVGVFMAPSNRLLAATWGILRAGAAYLPLAVDYPEERVRYMIADSRISHIVVDAQSYNLVVHLVPGHVQVLLLEQLIATGQDPHPDVVGPDLPAYVIYTSGSTGRPKGVVIPHAAIATQMNFLADFAGLTPGSRILLKTPTSFDAAQWELLANATGATVVVGPAGVHRDPEQICQLVLRHEVNLLQAVPTLWTALLETGRLPECRSLTGLFSGGEILATHLAQDLLRAAPQTQLMNLYGPTETTINATWFRLTSGQVTDEPAVSIGTAVPGCQIHILDSDLRPVPHGQTGELCISGVQLATGYLHRPELTEERFAQATIDDQPVRLYRSGDIARIAASGTVEFCGRSDDQVKVNGHRVETDEVRLAIEDHHWVRQAAVVPWRDRGDGTIRLGAFLELDPAEAALMDQDAAGEHHRSKASHVQVKAQLANLGVRSFEHQSRIALPRPEGTDEQRRTAFARKTYRFYEGAPLDKTDLVALGESLSVPWPVRPRRRPLSVHEVSEVLRWLGPFHSAERLLPKYAYASPGALNATQVYLETTGLPGLPQGRYYFHPLNHELVHLDDHAPELAGTALRLHLVGLPRVIESVYATNVVEVLHMEAGHIAGVLDRATADHGLHLGVRHGVECPELELTEDWKHTAVLDLLDGPAPCATTPRMGLTLQVHGKVPGVRQGTYRVQDEALHRVSDQLIERRQVIAINQDTYNRSSFGVMLSCSRGRGWAGFFEMGRALQRLQMNHQSIGLMSSGYASLSGRNLPSATRYDEIASAWSQCPNHLSYFAVGGPVSAEQVSSTGMKEDSVHVRGPEEIVKDDLRRFLPYYMVPSRVEVLEKLPMSNSGKADRVALIKYLEEDHGPQRETVPPSSGLEADVLKVWTSVLGKEVYSVADDFFDIGGNSLSAVKLIGALNDRFSSDLPVQAIFEAPTARSLTAKIGQSGPTETSRLVPLSPGHGARIYLWPGLGGYPMGLRGLGSQIANGRPVHGFQAHGLNPGECPYGTLAEMVTADGQQILDQAEGAAVTLMGYSFGARMAAEVASWVEERGVLVERLVLIAPGSPVIEGAADTSHTETLTFADPYFRMILMSVFTGTLDGAPENKSLSAVRDRHDFLELLRERLPTMDQELAGRIIDVVIATYGFRSGPVCNLEPLLPRTQVLIARGDGPSFVEPYRAQMDAFQPAVELPANHYQVLHEPAVNLTAEHILAGQEQPA